MKLVIVAAIAASALAMTQTPVAAQYDPWAHHDHDQWDHHDQWDYTGDPGDIDQRITWLQDRISRGGEDGSLGRHDIWRDEQDLNEIRQDEEHIRYRFGGHLPQDARARLQARLDVLGQEIRAQRHDQGGPWDDHRY